MPIRLKAALRLCLHPHSSSDGVVDFSSDEDIRSMSQEEMLLPYSGAYLGPDRDPFKLKTLSIIQNGSTIALFIVSSVRVFLVALFLLLSLQRTGCRVRGSKTKRHESLVELQCGEESCKINYIGDMQCAVRSAVCS
jgi:hypothetical protein